MAADCFTITEQWIRQRLGLQHNCLADVRSLFLPGTSEGKICRLGISLKNFVRLKTLDLSHNALVSIQGIEHLKMLEKLNLYYNRISSTQNLRTLRKLQNLMELDVRLNPVVKHDPHYRLYLIYALCKLRRLDDCPVRDRERRAAVMFFSTEVIPEPNEKSHLFTFTNECRSSELRVASINRLMKKQLVVDGNEETAMNLVARKDWAKGNPLAPATAVVSLSRPHHRLVQDNASEVVCLIKDFYLENSTHEQELDQFILRDPCCEIAPHGSSVRVGDAPRVTFADPSVRGSLSAAPRPRPEKTVQHIRIRGKSTFTPHPGHKESQPSDGQASSPKNGTQNSLDPVLHPPRVHLINTQGNRDPERTSATSNSKSRQKFQKGNYRKPMDLFLSMMNDHWSGGSEGQSTKSYLTHTLQILSVTQKHIAHAEEEIRALRQKIEMLNTESELQEMEHKSQILSLSSQLEQANGSMKKLDRQFRSVLEENVSLQKQLVTIEKKHLSSKKKTTSKENVREGLQRWLATGEPHVSAGH